MSFDRREWEPEVESLSIIQIQWPDLALVLILNMDNKLDTGSWSGKIRGPRPHYNNARKRMKPPEDGVILTWVCIATHICAAVSIVDPVRGLTNRKCRKSNWRNSISRRQWSPRRIIARVVRRVLFQKLRSLEISFEISSHIPFSLKDDLTRPKDSR